LIFDLKARRQTRAERFIWSRDYLLIRHLLAGMRVVSPAVTGRVLDVGCGHKPYQGYFPAAEGYLGLDVSAVDSSPDLIGSGLHLPFGEEVFESVLCLQTLEHVPDPFAVVSELARVLRPGGALVLTVPQAWRIHEPPHDYYRYTRYALRYLAERHGLQVERIISQGGVWAVLGQTLLNVLPGQLGCLAAPLNLPVNVLFSCLDFIWRDRRDTLNYVMLARKTRHSPEL
jgi:SAM-dependent methyltransferase